MAAPVFHDAVVSKKQRFHKKNLEGEKNAIKLLMGGNTKYEDGEANNSRKAETEPPHYKIWRGPDKLAENQREGKRSMNCLIIW